MSLNLMDLVKGHITNKVVGSLGGLLGESEDKTNSAITSAIPALIGGLMKKSSTSEGAASLISAIDDDKDNDGFLDDILGAFGGGNHQGVLDRGNGILGSLFGGGLGGVTDIIAKASGLGRSSSGSLLGLLAPIVMGVLGRAKKENNLDAGGLASMLKDQGQHIGGSLPEGLSDSLGLGNILGSIGGAAGDAASSAAGAVKGAASGAADLAGDAAGAVGDTAKAAGGAVVGGAKAAGGAVADAGGAAADAAGGAAKAGGSLLGKLIPLIILVGLGLLLMKMCGGAKDKLDEAGDMIKDGAAGAGDMIKDGAAGAGDMIKDGAGAVGDAAGGVSLPGMPKIEGFDVSNPVEGMKGVFSNTTEVLGGITDGASAEAAAPKLEGINDKLGLIGKIPGIGDKIGELVGGQMGGITSQIDRIKSIPGVGENVTGLLGKLVDLLKGFMG